MGLTQYEKELWQALFDEGLENGYSEFEASDYAWYEMQVYWSEQNASGPEYII